MEARLASTSLAVARWAGRPSGRGVMALRGGRLLVACTRGARIRVGRQERGRCMGAGLRLAPAAAGRSVWTRRLPVARYLMNIGLDQAAPPSCWLTRT